MLLSNPRYLPGNRCFYCGGDCNEWHLSEYGGHALYHFPCKVEDILRICDQLRALKPTRLEKHAEEMRALNYGHVQGRSDARGNVVKP